MTPRPLLAALLLALSAAPLAAQQPAEAELALREQLRATALQLRTAETEKANALATLAGAKTKAEELNKEIDDLNARLTAATKRASEDKVAAEQTTERLNGKLAELERRLREFAAANAEWKATHAKAAAEGRKAEEARDALTTEAVALKHTIADRERKNLTLYNLALEILDRYEAYSLGKALAAREPFIQKTRVTVESQVDGYKDKIIDNRISAPPKTDR